jgi:hypothetical protein
MHLINLIATGELYFYLQVVEQYLAAQCIQIFG